MNPNRAASTSCRRPHVPARRWLHHSTGSLIESEITYSLAESVASTLVQRTMVRTPFKLCEFPVQEWCDNAASFVRLHFIGHPSGNQPKYWNS